MKQNAISSIAKGVTVGTVVGTATYLIANNSKKDGVRGMKRNTGKAFKAVGDIMENISYMMK